MSKRVQLYIYNDKFIYSKFFFYKILIGNNLKYFTSRSIIYIFCEISAKEMTNSLAIIVECPITE